MTFLLFSEQNGSKGPFFNACKLICHNKAHATVIMKFIKRKWNGNGSGIELVCDYVKRKTFLFVDFFNFTLYFFSFYPPAFFFQALPHFQLFPLSPFHLFASFCRNAAVEVKTKATASDWDTCLNTRATSKQTRASTCFVFYINVLSCTSSSAAFIVVMLIHHSDGTWTGCWINSRSFFVFSGGICFLKMHPQSSRCVFGATWAPLV